MIIRPRRSVLYMPGSSARALEKAKSLPADSLILDLEDAVAPDAKEVARAQVCEAASSGEYGDRELVIRINGLDTPWGVDDLAAAAEARPDAILVPKVSSPDVLQAAEQALADADPQIALWAMMETPLGVLNAEAVASAGGRLACMVMGTNDLAKDTRASLDSARFGMVAWLSICVAAARAHGLAIIDGVYNAIGDADGLAAECAQGRLLGMDGKTLIHPTQIAPANAAFAPSAEEIAAARAVIEAFEQPEHMSAGVISLNGRMVERLHAEMARRTLALAEAIGATGHRPAAE